MISWSDVSSDLVRTRLLMGNAVLVVAGAGSAYYKTYSKALLERFSELEVLVGGYIVGGLRAWRFRCWWTRSRSTEWTWTGRAYGFLSRSSVD